MAHSRDYDSIYEASPADTQRAGYGAARIREFKSDIRERLELDHHMDSGTDTSDATADGYHKKVTMGKSDTSPAGMTDAGIVYTKQTNGVVELYYKNDSGVEVRLTSDGDLNTEAAADGSIDPVKLAGVAINAAGDDWKLGIQTGCGPVSYWREDIHVGYVYQFIHFYSYPLPEARGADSFVFANTGSGITTASYSGGWRVLWSSGTVNSTAQPSQPYTAANFKWMVLYKQ